MRNQECGTAGGGGGVRNREPELADYPERITGTARAQVIASHDGIEVEYQLPAAACVRATVHDAVGRQLGVLDAG
ncbi:MAG TPA: hypothetical protein VM537_12595, partial [Anaerolineae bacterium]|nr:hypothetical protein [Anaerolineae bacterium]